MISEHHDSIVASAVSVAAVAIPPDLVSYAAQAAGAVVTGLLTFLATAALRWLWRRFNLPGAAPSVTVATSSSPTSSPSSPSTPSSAGKGDAR